MGKKHIHTAFQNYAEALAHLEIKKKLLSEKQLAVFYRKMEKFEEAYKSLLEIQPVEFVQTFFHEIYDREAAKLN